MSGSPSAADQPRRRASMIADTRSATSLTSSLTTIRSPRRRASASSAAAASSRRWISSSVSVPRGGAAPPARPAPAPRGNHLGVREVLEHALDALDVHLEQGVAARVQGLDERLARRALQHAVHVGPFEEAVGVAQRLELLADGTSSAPVAFAVTRRTRGPRHRPPESGKRARRRRPRCPSPHRPCRTRRRGRRCRWTHRS